jgi:hypothetical protein
MLVCFYGVVDIEISRASINGITIFIIVKVKESISDIPF